MKRWGFTYLGWLLLQYDVSFYKEEQRHRYRPREDRAIWRRRQLPQAKEHQGLPEATRGKELPCLKGFERITALRHLDFRLLPSRTLSKFLLFEAAQYLWSFARQHKEINTQPCHRSLSFLVLKFCFYLCLPSFLGPCFSHASFVHLYLPSPCLPWVYHGLGT